MLLPVFRLLLPAVLLAAALALTGCSSYTSPAATRSSAAQVADTDPKPGFTPLPTETSTPEPVPDAAWGVTCSTDGDDEQFASYRDAWAPQRAGEKFYECDGVQVSSGPESTAVTAALKAAKYDDDDPSTLFGMCATLHDSYYSMSSYSPSQVDELTGMLILCPDHPKAKSIAAKFGKSKKIAEELANGERFYAGTYRVGKQIKAGTYVVKGDLSGCYWERLDEAGNIIDNNFMSGGTRAEVTVAPTDYSFVNRECGQWVLQK